MGDGPVRFVFVHGLLGDSTEWAGVMAMLGGIASVAIDVRGHGESDGGRGDVALADLAEDIAALAALTADQPVMLVGQSMGGVAAFEAARRHPSLFSALVLVESGIGAGGETASSRVREELRAFPATLTDAEYDGALASDALWVVRASYRRGADGWLRHWDVGDMQSIMDDVFADDRRREWRSLTTPAAIVVAERSAVDADEIAALRIDRPDALYIEIAGSAHDVHLDQPRALADLLLTIFS